MYEFRANVAILLNITPDSLKESWIFKKYPFFRDQVETCDVTGKQILPVSVDETVSEKVYRKDPHSEKTIIQGLNSSGVNELFNTGDMLTTVLKDIFQDIDIYQDRFRFLQYPFDSPVSNAGSRGIECGCIATRTAAHDDHIVYMIRIHRTSLLLTFAHVTCASVFSWRFL